MADQNESGRGSTGQPQQSSGVGGLSFEGCSVLLVDDNEQNLELLQAYLDGLGCEVRLARDGEDAMRQVEDSAPDIVLLDVMMPRMSGFQVCQLLKRDERWASIPVVMVTALNEIGDVERAVECGADDFLTKPVSRVELVTRVRSLLRVRRLATELDQTMAELDRLRGGSGGEGGASAP